MGRDVMDGAMKCSFSFSFSFSTGKSPAAFRMLRTNKPRDIRLKRRRS
jgi:hypothetical protein